MQLRHSELVCLPTSLFFRPLFNLLSPPLPLPLSNQLPTSLSDFVGKKPSDALFNLIDTSRLNAHLKDLMPGLTAKVFRTYNASITLDDIVS